MTFAKLDSNLPGSSLLAQGGLELVGFWAILLAKKDRRGEIFDSIPKLAHDCYITRERVRELLDVLASPDPDSRTPDHEGRRIEIRTDPWCIRVLNHERFRREVSTERVRRFRERLRATDRNNVKRLQERSASVSASASVSGVVGGSGGEGDDNRGEERLHHSRVALERRFYQIIDRLAQLQPEKDPGDIALEISSYEAHGRRIAGKKRPERMSDEHLERSIADGEAWVAKLEAERGAP